MRRNRSVNETRSPWRIMRKLKSCLGSKGGREWQWPQGQGEGVPLATGGRGSALKNVRQTFCHQQPLGAHTSDTLLARHIWESATCALQNGIMCSNSSSSRVGDACAAAVAATRELFMLLILILATTDVYQID